MTWFLALQGPAHMPNQSSNHELQDSADAENTAQELVNAAALDRVVPIPVVLSSPRRQNVTLYVRPTAWGAWTFFHLSDEDRRQLNETVNALSRAAQQRGRAGQQEQTPTGQPGPGSLGSLGTRP